MTPPQLATYHRSIMNAWDVCLTHDPVYGGIYRSVCTFARALEGRILSFDDGCADRAVLHDERPTVRIAARPRLWNRACHVVMPAMRVEAEALLRGADLLVVHSLFRGHAPWAARWSREHGRPLWAVPEGCLDPWALRRHAIAKRLWLARYGRGFFAGATTIFATARERTKAASVVGDGRSVVIHWPVPLPRLEGREAARDLFRTAHGIPSSARMLLFVARLHPMKRPLDTIDAFVRAGVPQAHLVVAGMEEGVTVSQLAARVPAECRGRVHLGGQLAGDRLAEAFLASDGFISLSHRENFGYSFAESLASGLPAIVSAGHDLAHDIMPPGDAFPCGWLLDGDAAVAAVGAIREWAAAPAARLATMGATGRTWAGEELSFERFRDRLRGLSAAG
ncbi:MAG: glycosyltransferase [Planctomycetia bacterium]